MFYPIKASKLKTIFTYKKIEKTNNQNTKNKAIKLYIKSNHYDEIKIKESKTQCQSVTKILKGS